MNKASVELLSHNGCACLPVCHSNFTTMKENISCGFENETGMLSKLLSCKAAVRSVYLENRGRWACMVPVGAVTAHVTVAAPAIAPGIPHMRGKASSPPAFATSPHQPVNTTVVSMHGKNTGLIIEATVEVHSSWQLLLATSWRYLSTHCSDVVYISACFWLWINNISTNPPFCVVSL